MNKRQIGKGMVVVCGLTLLAVLAAGAMVACSGEKRQAKPAEVTATLRDVPDVLRGTIGSEATIRGVEPVLVSGLGIVVGLNGTGGGELPVQVQSTMERELALGGIGRGGAAASTDIGPMSPQEFLRSPNVAVVIVQAAIPPGAPKGARFDVFVHTLPGSSVTSLEGGMLWSVDLRLGQPAVFGAIKTRRLAEAAGPVFVNPFSALSSDGSSQGVTRTVGRVIGGGIVTEPLAMELLLDNESHSRARSVVAAINSRFPQGPGDDGPIARGRGRSGSNVESPQSIALTVPAAYKDRASEFIQLISHLRVDQGFQQEYAKLYTDALKAQPGMATELSWCLQALGKPALPMVATMYDYPEVGPRFAALEAGARLGDARTVAPLSELAKGGPAGVRAQAIRLLGRMPANPSVNFTLRELMDAAELDVRVSAYEGLRARGDSSIVSLPIGTDPRRPKFVLDLVQCAGEPMVYVAQQGEARLVVFGDAASTRRPGKFSGVTLRKPLSFGVWDDRLMLASEDSATPVRLRYQDPRKPQPTQMARVPEDLGELVPLLAHKTTPEEPGPGLNLTYSDVVGVLYEMTRQGVVVATFATEQDRLRAEVYEASQSTELTDRPESTEGGKAEIVQAFKTLESPMPAGEGKQPKDGKLTRVVPINRASTEKKQK